MVTYVRQIRLSLVSCIRFCYYIIKEWDRKRATEMRIFQKMLIGWNQSTCHKYLFARHGRWMNEEYLVFLKQNGWTGNFAFAFAHKDKICSPFGKRIHDPSAPYDAYDESDDTEENAKGIRLKGIGRWCVSWDCMTLRLWCVIWTTRWQRQAVQRILCESTRSSPAIHTATADIKRKCKMDAIIKMDRPS